MTNKNLWNSIQVKAPKKTAFDLTHDVKMSCNMGELVPIMNIEVLPGDSISIGNENLIRFAPLIAPVMHRMDVSTHYFFVPNRILWDGWEDFIVASPDATAHPYLAIVPDIVSPSTTRMMGFFGVNAGEPGTATLQNINAFPFAAFQKIYDDYYRDQNLIETEPNSWKLTTGANNIAATTQPRYRAWEHDYFTSSLPFAQKGAAVNIPIAGIENDVPVFRNHATGSGTTLTGSPDNIHVADRPAVVGDKAIGSDELFAWTDGSQIAAGTINDLRRAYKLQEWLEKNARAGTRYIENILAHFGVRSSDARLQRPEYICGSKSPVVVSEVLNNTGESGGLPQGNMAGHALSLTQGKQGHYYAEEHGWIIGIMSVMPKPAYQQGIPKPFLKSTYLDYAFPEFAHLGEQEVLNKELFWGASSNDDIFGYVPRYAEYKYQPNRVAGEFKDSLDYWHLSRIFASRPLLNQEFIECKPADTTRIFAVTDPTIDHLYCQIVNHVRAVRPLPYFGTPSI